MIIPFGIVCIMLLIIIQGPKAWNPSRRVSVVRVLVGFCIPLLIVLFYFFVIL